MYIFHVGLNVRFSIESRGLSGLVAILCGTESNTVSGLSDASKNGGCSERMVPANGVPSSKCTMRYISETKIQLDITPTVVVVWNLDTKTNIPLPFCNDTFVVVFGAIIGHFQGSDVIIGHFRLYDRPWPLVRKSLKSNMYHLPGRNTRPSQKSYSSIWPMWARSSA